MESRVDYTAQRSGILSRYRIHRMFRVLVICFGSLVAANAKADISTPIAELPHNSEFKYAAFTRCTAYKAAVANYIGPENIEPEKLAAMQNVTVRLFNSAVEIRKEGAGITLEQSVFTTNNDVNSVLFEYVEKFDSAKANGTDALQSDPLLAADSHFCGIDVLRLLE